MLDQESRSSGPEFLQGCVALKKSPNLSEPGSSCMKRDTGSCSTSQQQLQGCKKIKDLKEVGLPVGGTGSRRGGIGRKLRLQGLALVPERGESSWGRKAGWRPEVCLTRIWCPSGLGIQGAASGAQLGEAWKKAVEQGLGPQG